MNTFDRFNSKTSIDSSGCWLWTGARADGYGQFYLDTVNSKRQKRVLAHRWSYEHFVGPIPDGLTIDHVCHQPPCSGGASCFHRRCVNPAHLEPVTRAENAARSSRAWQTHCRNGHEYTPGNTRIIDGNRRQCITCQNARSLKNWRAKQPDAERREFWI